MDEPAPDIRATRYQLGQRLGSGGTGTVFQAFDQRRGHDVALKILHLEDADAIYRIKREFRTLQPVTHPNLIRLYDLVSEAGTSFFTMELAAGWAFDDYILGERSEAGEERDTESLTARLISSTRQLTDAVETIHSHGILHRDIKPGNVTVLRGGRLVLLDFGFAIESKMSELRTVDFAGTPIFIAPEQMDGMSCPASDYYSLGMMLRYMFRQRDGEYLPVTPRGLPELVKALTHPEPEHRAGAVEIKAWCSDFDRNTASILTSVNLFNERFLGRADEMATLRTALGDVSQSRQPRLVRVHGPSGIGKTELVRRFVEKAEVMGRKPLVLSARCHLNEAVSFRTLDGVVDELSRYLISLPDSELSLLVPDNVAALVRLFPVLGRIERFRGSMQRGEQDLNELRRIASRSLRQLMSKIAMRRTLILYLDDCQWIDPASLELLQQVLSLPDAPPILAVFNDREERLDTETGVDREQSYVERLAAMADAAGLVLLDVALAPLETAESIALLQDCIATSEITISSEQIEAAIETCGGNPLLLWRFSRLLVAGGTEFPDTWLEFSAAGLPAQERQLIELVSVCSQPLAIDALKRIDPAAFQTVDSLCEQQWLKPRLFRSRVCFDIFHDRIRDSVLQNLDQQHVAALHLLIADALSADPETGAYELVAHYREGGKHDLAAAHALQAAEEAQLSLAFEMAADLFQQAFELRGSRQDDWWILERRARSLAGSGAHLQSAELYERAADLIRTDQTMINARLHLEVNAATQYLHGEGRKALVAYKNTARQLGLNPDPGQRWRTVVKRLPYLLHTPSMKRATPVPDLVDRVQMISSLSRGVAVTDYRLYMDIGHLWLQESLGCGDQLEAGYAMGTEATMLSFLGRPFRAASHRLMQVCEDWLLDGGLPYDQIRVANWWGTIYYNEGRWRDCVDSLFDVEPVMQMNHPTEHRQLSIVRTWLFSSLSMLGEFEELARRLPPVLEDASTRGDPAGIAVSGLGASTLTWLAVEQPDQIHLALDRLAPRRQEGRYGPHRFDVVMGLYWQLCYEERINEAESLIETMWPLFESSGTLKMSYHGITLRIARASIAVAAIKKIGATSERKRRAEKTLAELRRYAVPHADASRLLIMAELANRKSRTAKLLTNAASSFMQQGMRLHALAAQYRLAELEGKRNDVSTRRIQRDIEALGVKNPVAMRRVYVPSSD